MSYSWGSDSTSNWEDSSGGFSYGSAKAAYSDFDADKAYAGKKSGGKSSVGTASSAGKSLDMKSAYMVSSRVMDAALPLEDRALLKGLTKDQILVVRGQYDSVEKVLGASDTPYKMINGTVNLDSKQIVLVNCPGGDFNYRYGSRSGHEALRKFVEEGGFLVTTDWALDRVIVPAFPGYIAHGGRDTADDVVEVDLVAAGSPYTKGLGGGSLKPVWWLEGSSYPIKPLRKEGLEILLGSQEMGNKYGETPIAVKFPVGDGRVVHVTSHFYLQTTKSKYEAQANKSGLDFATKFLGIAKDEAKEIDGIGDISFGALESAYTSVRFLHNIFLQKLKQGEAGFEQLSPGELKQIGAMNAKSLRKLPPGVTVSKKLV